MIQKNLDLFLEYNFIIVLQICLLFQKLGIIYNLNTITVDSAKNIANTRIEAKWYIENISFTPKQILKNM